MNNTVLMGISFVFFSGLTTFIWWNVRQWFTGNKHNFEKLFSLVEKTNISLIAVSKDISSLDSKQISQEKRLDRYSKETMKHLEQLAILKTEIKLLNR